MELIIHKSIEETIIILYQLYDEGLVNEIIEDIYNPDKALKYYNLPNCFECETCSIKTDCKYFDIMKVVKKIQVHSRKDINQMDLKEFFYSSRKPYFQLTCSVLVQVLFFLQAINLPFQ